MSGPLYADCPLEKSFLNVPVLPRVGGLGLQMAGVQWKVFPGDQPHREVIRMAVPKGKRTLGARGAGAGPAFLH